MVNLLTGPLLLALLLMIALLAGRVVGRQRDPVSAMAIGGTILVAMTLSIVVALHCLAIPVRALVLLPIYLGLCAVLSIVYAATRRQNACSLPHDITHLWLPGITLFSILILPYTRFTGIDTYKWQDLASAIRVEGNIPWLVHPLSLLGFTQRSYPSAHPALLGSTEIMGHLSVEAGFGVTSIFVAILGAAAAYHLGRCVFDKQRAAIVFSLLYVFSPVFTRYAHWATGRGLFLALFPLLLAALLRLPRKNAWFGLVAGAVLVSLSHKVGLVVSIAILPLMLAELLIPARSNRLVIAISLIPSLVLATLIVSPAVRPFPVGNAFGLLRFSLTRFGWLIPVAALGLLGPRHLLHNPAWRRLYPFMLIAIPLAFERQMYGALVALPLITLAATEGALWLTGIFPTRARTITRALAIATLLFSMATIIHRSRDATPTAVYRAAQFLEQHDPKGPFVIHAPGRARTQIQAYVSGCPRFNVDTGPRTAFEIAAPPGFTGKPRQILERWISYMRGFMGASGTTTDWYGVNPQHYYVVIDGKGKRPNPDTEIYSDQGVQILVNKSAAID